MGRHPEDLDPEAWARAAGDMWFGTGFGHDVGIEDQALGSSTQPREHGM